MYLLYNNIDSCFCIFNKRETIGRKDMAEGTPLLTNTTVSVLRLCGKYLQMSKYLKPIASQVVSALTQLFDFYLYTVHSFFTTNMPVRIIYIIFK